MRFVQGRRSLLSGVSRSAHLLFLGASALVLVLALLVERSDAQFLLAPIPAIPYLGLPVVIEEPLLYTGLFMPIAGFMTGLALLHVLPIRVNPNRLLRPFLDATSSSSSSSLTSANFNDRLQNITSAVFGNLPFASAGGNNNTGTASGGSASTINCTSEAMTVFDAVRCRFNSSADFDYRTMLRTIAEDPSAFTPEQQRQLWIYNTAKELADMIMKKSESSGANPPIDSNEVRSAKKRRFGREMSSAPATGSSPSSDALDAEDGDADDDDGDDSTIPLAIEAIIVSDWKSCLSEMACEVDKASWKYGVLSAFQRSTNTANSFDEENEVDDGGRGWIFGQGDCSEQYKKCAFNFKRMARSLFR